MPSRSLLHPHPLLCRAVDAHAAFSDVQAAVQCLRPRRNGVGACRGRGCTTKGKAGRRGSTCSWPVTDVDVVWRRESVVRAWAFRRPVHPVAGLSAMSVPHGVRQCFSRCSPYSSSELLRPSSRADSRFQRCQCRGTSSLQRWSTSTNLPSASSFSACSTGNMP